MAKEQMLTMLGLI